MSKLIIIGKNDARELEFEEVLEMYKPLIMSEIHSFDSLKMEFDDKYQLATMGLWNAYKKYDAETTVGFGILAKIAIENNLKHAITYTKMKKRSGLELVCMDRTMKGKDNEDNSIADMLEADTNIEEHIVLKSNLKEFMSKITDKQRETIALYVTGMQYEAISKILGVGKSTISMRMAAAKKTFNKCMAV